MVAADPFEKEHEAGPKISQPADIFAPERPNSKGFDLSNPEVLAHLQAQRARRQTWSYGDLGQPHPVHSPATGDQIGQIKFLSADQARQLAAAATPWQAHSSPAGRDVCAKLQISMSAMRRSILLCSPMRPVKH